MTNNKTLLAQLIGLAVSGVVLVGCGQKSSAPELTATGASSSAIHLLPYSIYMSGTFTDWTQTAKNQFVLDEKTGVYHLNNIKAGLTADGNLRRFKITGENWNNQFGMGLAGEATPQSQTTIQFEKGYAKTTLTALPAIKDIYLPLAGDQDGSSAEQLVDFRLTPLDATATQLALEVELDNPPLTSTLTLRTTTNELIELPYLGDGIYRAGIVLAQGKNTFTVQTAKQEYLGAADISSANASELSVCAESCTITADISTANAYELLIVADQKNADAKPRISLRELTPEEAVSATPHFGADGDIVSTDFAPYPLDKSGRTETVKVSVKNRSAELRSFALTSTQFQRDEKPKTRTFSEVEGMPRVVTGNLLFDALFAQAIDDMKQASVSEIRDGNYNVGAAIPCDCFETGEKWNYVWTRDLSYAANLSLAYLDPQRVVNSMLFKTSGFRDGVTVPAALPENTTQIIQDTGSGGSWPVSTDRVSWSAAAETVLNSLSGEARADFAKKAYAALRGTIEADRLVAFDPSMGLYGGEQSYLDWRTQTYAPWIINNLARMASSKALSTNVMHYQAIRLTARLARENGEQKLAQEYEGWADNLKQQINKKLWLSDKGLYASLTTAAEDQAPMYKYDMLGSALAILYGVASPEQAAQVMANYPHAPYGVPVYYPQQPNVYVYHNRSIWPFVTAYSLRAAKQVKNTQAANNAIHSLMRGAALNLSNMENFEWLTMKPWYDNGPAISSRRQLWSVGAYLGMTLETLFGYQVTADGFSIEPFLTTELRNQLGDSSSAVLKDLTYQGKVLAIELQLPEKTTHNGYYQATAVTLNGNPVKGKITAEMLAETNNRIEVKFGELIRDAQKITLVADVDPLSHTAPSIYAPEVPVLNNIQLSDGKFTLQFSDAINPAVGEVNYNIYHNGKLITEKHKGFVWQDTRTPQLAIRNCFAVQAVFTASGNASHHSEPQCYEQGVAQIIPVTDERVVSNIAVTPASATLEKPSLIEWGKTGDELQVNRVAIDENGVYAVQLIYNNRQSTIDSGVTAAVKMLSVKTSDGAEVGSGAIVMPNVEDRGGIYPLRSSTEVTLSLKKGLYQFSLHDFFNMSYLTSNQTYAGKGGKTGAVNTATIAEIKIVRIQ